MATTRKFRVAPPAHPNGPVPTRRDDAPVKAIRPYERNPLIEPVDPSDPVKLNEIVDAVGSHRKKEDPVNEYIIRRASEYNTELPALLSKNMEAMREFVLREVFPLVISVPNAIRDVSDVVQSVTDEEPDLTKVSSLLDGLVAYAVRIKAVSFVAELSNLTPGEAALLRTVDFSMLTGAQNGSSDLQAFMRQMLEVPPVQGPAEKRSSSRVRQLHPPKGSGLNPRLPGSAADPKGGGSRKRPGEASPEGGKRRRT